MSTRVAVLGTGRMGSAIAERLAQFEPTLWNRTRARAEELGVGKVVDTPAQAVAQADVVITSLTGPDAVRAVYGGPDGAISAASGQLFVEASTAGPDMVAELEPQLAATGSRVIDAPISGAPPTVRNGAAAILVGGDPADVERARPVLELLGDVRHIGPLGSGARLKLVANSMLGAVTAAASELQAAGEAAGLPPEEVFRALVRLVPALEVRKSAYLGAPDAPTLFAVRDLRKDLDLARALFGKVGSATPVTELTRQIVDEAAGQIGDRDIAAIVTRYRSDSGR